MYRIYTYDPKWDVAHKWPQYDWRLRATVKRWRTLRRWIYRLLSEGYDWEVSIYVEKAKNR